MVVRCHSDVLRHHRWRLAGFEAVTCCLEVRFLSGHHQHLPSSGLVSGCSRLTAGDRSSPLYLTRLWHGQLRDVETLSRNRSHAMIGCKAAGHLLCAALSGAAHYRYQRQAIVTWDGVSCLLPWLPLLRRFPGFSVAWSTRSWQCIFSPSWWPCFTQTKVEGRRREPYCASIFQHCSVRNPSDGAVLDPYLLSLVMSHMTCVSVVHELAHLLRHDHSPEFWRLVELAMPDYTDRRDRLRRLGPDLWLPDTAS
jgi:YgjP-like, metallopeptidase domain